MKYALLVLFLSGCASFEGVQMDERERAACAAEGCNVHTDKNLREWYRFVFNEGYQAGRKSL